MAYLQMLNVGFIKKYAITLGIVSYQSLFQNPVPLALLSPNYFSLQNIVKINSFV